MCHSEFQSQLLKKLQEPFDYSQFPVTAQTFKKCSKKCFVKLKKIHSSEVTKKDVSTSTPNSQLTSDNPVKEPKPTIEQKDSARSQTSTSENLKEKETTQTENWLGKTKKLFNIPRDRFWNRPESSARQAALRTRDRLDQEFLNKLDHLHDGAIRTGLVTKEDLQDAYRKSRDMERNPNRVNMWYTFGIMAFVMLLTPLVYNILTFLLGVKCFLPNNHLVWEATRPISDCGFCRGVDGPLVLKNMTREEFGQYAYSSLPIVIKNAVNHWPAYKFLTLQLLKEIYERHPSSLDEDCHFLNFHSDLKCIRDVFNMPIDRANLSTGPTWYVGWSNCHPGVLEELRQLYGRPHFLPADAEMSNTDYVFLGYEQGAYMHLDYVHRLMWQAQLKGNKSWILAPTPECDYVCNSFSFIVEPGDAVLIDTRTWYHGTSIPKGQFTLTIQSEYG